LINKTIILISALLVSVLLYSCSDSPSSIGNSLLSPDFITVNKLDSYQDSVPQSSTYYKTAIKISDSPRLFVGKYANIEASSLMRFGIVLPDSVKQAVLNSNLNIISAKIELIKEYSIGNRSTNLNYSVHSVSSGWTSFGFTADSISSLVYDNTDVSSNRNISDSLYSFNIDNQTIQSWFLAAADTSIPHDQGIYIKPDPASDRIIGFDAFNVDLIGIPKLTVIVEKPGSFTDTLSYYSIEDVSAIAGDLPSVPQEDIAVQAGLAVDARVEFDLSAIPKNTIINNAQFSIYLDSSATKTADSYTNSLVAYFVSDSSSNAYDTTSGIVLNRVNNYFTGNIARFVQSVVSGYHENQGIILTAGGQNIGVDIFAFKGSEATDRSLRPRLVITYTGRK